MKPSPQRNAAYRPLKQSAAPRCDVCLSPVVSATGLLVDADDLAVSDAAAA
jgi:hypothetical protein